MTSLVLNNRALMNKICLQQKKKCMDILYELMNTQVQLKSYENVKNIIYIITNYALAIS